MLKKIGDPIKHAETDATPYNNYLCRVGKVFFVSYIVEISAAELEYLVKHYQPSKAPKPNSTDGNKYFFVYYETGGQRITIPLEDLADIRQIVYD
jgi:hypothetical protein